MGAQSSGRMGETLAGELLVTRVHYRRRRLSRFPIDVLSVNLIRRAFASLAMIRYDLDVVIREIRYQMPQVN